MQTSGTQHFVERAYRESGPFQWVRETLVNALEAGATRIEYGIEWQAVEAQGVYRRVIADNGRGMTPQQLVEFFNTFGGSGKPIGGAHENFGVGAKTSLLPWNPYGIVVISWVNGEAAMIWVKRDAKSGEYGLKLERAADENTGESSIDEVYAPYADEAHGCNWAALKPQWLKDHGTVVVLMGKDARTDTVLGDPNREEQAVKGVSAYLNRRIWDIPEGTEVYVDELRTNAREGWPESEMIAHSSASKSGQEQDRRTNTRRIEGAKHFIQYGSSRFAAGRLAHSDVVALADGTRIEWYLWEGERPAVSAYAAEGGYIAARYKNELYDQEIHQAKYRSFGIVEASVRRLLWLIVVPPEMGADGKHGVYPRQDRNALLLRGGPNAGGSLPFAEWAAEFADRMPEPIRDALSAARKGDPGSLDDDAWRQRLAERFGDRWRIAKLRVRPSGSLTVNPTQSGGTLLKKRVKGGDRAQGGGGGGSGGRVGGLTLGTEPGSHQAERVKVGGGIPKYRPVRKEDLSEGMLAAWQPHDPVYPEGVVLLNIDHPVLRTEIERWQSQFADHLADEIEQEVVRAYGEIAVAKVAHSEHLRTIVPSKVIDDEFRSEAALTMSLLGLIAEEAVIAPRLGGKFRKRREGVAL